MLIRPATHADLPPILAIYNWAVLNTSATCDLQPQSLQQRTAWLAVHERDGYLVFVAEDEAGRVYLELIV